MKIGVFDSGLGGLLIAKTLFEHLPNYDYLYLGDTLHVPYGKRSTRMIYHLTKQCVEWLFQQDCQLIIIACNTANAAALRKIQQDYLPYSPYKDRRVLGVIVPTLEETLASGSKNIGLIGTRYTIQSNIYQEELQKIDPYITLHSQETPLLVPLIEDNGLPWLKSVLENYLSPFKNTNIDALILGCTHYTLLAPLAQEILGNHVHILNQQTIIPSKLATYLNNHPEHDAVLTKTMSRKFYMTDLSHTSLNAACRILNHEISIDLADIFNAY